MNRTYKTYRTYSEITATVGVTTIAIEFDCLAFPLADHAAVLVAFLRLATTGSISALFLVFVSHGFLLNI